MRFALGFIGFLVVLSLSAHGGKVTFGANGKAKIDQKGPIKGCSQGGLDSLDQDNNDSKSCEK